MTKQQLLDAIDKTIDLFLDPKFVDEDERLPLCGPSFEPFSCAVCPVNDEVFCCALTEDRELSVLHLCFVREYVETDL